MRHLGDPQAYAAALQQAGYATAPNYASVLGSIIEKTQRLQSTVPAMAAAMLPTTTQMLNLRQQGGQTTADSALSVMSAALNTLPGGSGLPVVGSRQWRQSPYAELGLPKICPDARAQQRLNRRTDRAQTHAQLQVRVKVQAPDGQALAGPQTWAVVGV